jgi:hypothetical protein
MTTVESFANIPASSPADTALYFLDQSKLVFQKQTVSQDNLTLTSYYKYADGVRAENTRVIVTHRTDPVAGMSHFTIRLETKGHVVVDSEETSAVMAAATIGLSVPSVMEDTAKMLAFIGSAFSLFFDGVTSKVPNAGVINPMTFGVIDSLYP